jgi:hypothetical protein
MHLDIQKRWAITPDESTPLYAQYQSFPQGHHHMHQVVRKISADLMLQHEAWPNDIHYLSGSQLFDYSTNVLSRP